MSKYEEFYNSVYEEEIYANRGEKSPFESILKKFVEEYKINMNAKCLEIGSGRGALQDVFEDYTGVDMSESVEKNYHKPFVHASATKLPFSDNTFDFCWTEAVLEHIPDIENALSEMIRVTKPDGILFLAPAWYCKTWFSWGGHTSSISEVHGKQKIIRLFIPFLMIPAVQFITFIPRRLHSLINLKVSKRPIKLYYTKLKANYDEYLGPDSDACNGLDPCVMAAWFESRGCQCLTHPTMTAKFFARTDNIGIVVKK